MIFKKSLIKSSFLKNFQVSEIILGERELFAMKAQFTRIDISEFLKSFLKRLNNVWNATSAEVSQTSELCTCDTYHWKG